MARRKSSFCSGSKWLRAQPREAVRLSDVVREFPEADIEAAPLGIFGKAVKDDTVLRALDRVEIYRPLLIDPKEARRLRVQSKTEDEAV